uniref:A disintegrin and metallopeptidase domain 5 n=1 Tax=Jaculus jaculus TaxID=51337 RepID=A0A8C5K246_JACJA
EKISSPEAETDPEHHVAYHIKIAGKPYFVHLKQSFLSPTSVVYSYDKNGIQRSQTLSPQKNCSYNGYVAGYTNSFVTLNICSGLRLGTIQFKNVCYGIEPMEAVSGFVHIVYENSNGNAHIPVLGENDTYAWFSESQYQLRNSLNKFEFTKLFPQYIEMDIVVDKNLFDYMGSDTKAVTQKVVQMIGLVNTMLTQLKLTVVISSIDIWSNKNKISTTGHPDHVLISFLNWKHSDSNYKPHHISYLLVFDKHPASFGATFPGEICNQNYDAGVALVFCTIELLSLCTIILIVSAPLYFRHSGGIKEFSICSLDDFKSIASYNGLKCLQKDPFEMRSRPPPVRRICGNGLLEGNEECDCGTVKNCTHKLCCDPTQCRLKHKAQCGSGECCSKNCEVKPVNTLCRPSADECDFVEYCNGVNPYCVADTYSRNGQPCDSGGAYCYFGRCRTFDKQCQSLVGGESRGASFPCFEEMNSRTDRFGNCIGSYCTFERLLCGKLVCTWPHKKLVSRPNLSVVYSHVRDETCISMHKNSDSKLPNQQTTYDTHEDRDETFVEDGTICGPDMYCHRTFCKEIRHEIDYSKCNNTRDCNDHGICNNFQHCHCDKGFLPPNCEPKPGEFGSIDDGHKIKEGKSSWRERHAPLTEHRLLLILFIAIPVAIIIIFALIEQNKIRELCYRGESESERSVSEESSVGTTFSSSR